MYGMKLVGLTGGIGCGKSFLCGHLRGVGMPVIDTDDLARQLLLPGQPALELVRQQFGDEICSADGTLDRIRLSQIVFQDPDALKRLEQVLHPRIRESWEETVHLWNQQGISIGVIVIPLLFETGAQDRFDATISMACSLATQRRRLRERGWGEDHIHQRLSAQWSLASKVAASDYIIWTDTNFAATILQWEIIRQRITDKSE